jgi:hypothetical protein
MDGARFANATARLGCSPADATWRSGIDIMSFGATKNGGALCDAIVVFTPEIADIVAVQLRRAGQVWSKMRFASAQLIAMSRTASGSTWPAPQMRCSPHCRGTADLPAPAIGAGRASEIFLERRAPSWTRSKPAVFTLWRSKTLARRLPLRRPRAEADALMAAPGPRRGNSAARGE